MIECITVNVWNQIVMRMKQEEESRGQLITSGKISNLT